jgi:hypothetical protein
MNMINFAPLIKARKVLDQLWRKSQLRGRCWGPTKTHSNNPFARSNITIAFGDELITIIQNLDGSLRIHEFSRSVNTELGRIVEEILKEAGLKICK